MMESDNQFQTKLLQLHNMNLHMNIPLDTNIERPFNRIYGMLYPLDSTGFILYCFFHWTLEVNKWSSLRFSKQTTNWIWIRNYCMSMIQCYTAMNIIIVSACKYFNNHLTLCPRYLWPSYWPKTTSNSFQSYAKLWPVREQVMLQVNLTYQ